MPVHPFDGIHYYLNRLAQCSGTGLVAWIASWAGGVLSFVVLAFFGLLQFADPDQEFNNAGVKWISEQFWNHRLTVAVWLTGLLALSSFLVWVREVLPGGMKLELEKIHQELDRVARIHFGPPKADFTYRATLFKVRHFWPFGIWLGIVERSGSIHRKLDTTFSINPNDKNQCTGLAGKCWWNANANVASHFLHTLPNLRDNLALDHEYMRAGATTETEHKRIKIKSCFFRLVAIRRHGKVWGVLVLDADDVSVAPPTDDVDAAQTACVLDAAERITLIIE